MAIEYSFVDNESYGAGDINNAFAKLTTQGVSLFNDTGNPLISLDTAISNLTESGIEYYNTSACMVYLEGNIYKVKTGHIFMADGAILTVTSPHTITTTAGVINYVYAFIDIAYNKYDIACSTTQGSDDTVPIATILADGTILDTRKYARARVLMPTPNIFIEKSVTFEIPYGWIEAGTIYATIDVGWGAFSRVYFERVGDDFKKFTPIDENGFNLFGDIYQTFDTRCRKNGDKIEIYRPTRQYQRDYLSITLNFVIM